MLPSLLYQIIILYKACTTVSCNILLPCRFKCKLLLLKWVGFILSGWPINEKIFSLHSLSKFAFTFLALVWRWSFRGYYIKYSNMLFTSESYINTCNWFCNQSRWTVWVKVISPTCSTKWPGFCVSYGFAWSFRHPTFTLQILLTYIMHFFTFSAIFHSFT